MALRSRHSILQRLVVSAVFGIAAAASAQAAQKTTTGYVYVMTNDPTTNSIIQYSRATDGSLSQVQEVLTGGMGGTGNGVGDLDPLGSADSLVLTNSGALLLAVNAGSNQLASLTVDGTTVTAASNVDSGGVFPNSVAASATIAYVLNAHTPNIAGFTIGADGTLTPIAGAVFDVPGGTSVKAHDIRFAPDGKSLVVTDEGLNQIDVFALDDTGLVTGVTSTPSAGTGPFGFKFGSGGVLIDAEAGSGSASTYTLNTDGTLSVISGAVANGQLATCWLSLTSNGMFAFVSNTASGTLSTYHISPGDGTLDLANATSATLNGGGPIDSAISSDDAFLYAIDTVQGQIAPFRITGAALHPLAPVTGLPLTVQGIAAQ
jgi:6-phosphogluconolactonase (cycloisomerase 2 family)